jgi:hypothetical protein
MSESPFNDTPELRRLLRVGQGLLPALDAAEARRYGRLPVEPVGAAVMVHSRRNAELIVAVADDFFHHRPLAGGVVARALRESVLTLRWCVTAPENASAWWRAGDAQAQKVLRSARRSDDPTVVAVREAAVTPPKVPALPGMARAVGVLRAYEVWYPALSAYAHSNRLGMHFAYRPRGTGAMPPSIVPCLYIASDAARVFESWSTGMPCPPPEEHP